jgi:hypothetical protein
MSDIEIRALSALSRQECEETLAALKEIFKKEVQASEYSAWIEPLFFVATWGSGFYVGAADYLSRDTFNRQYARKASVYLTQACGFAVEVRAVIAFAFPTMIHVQDRELGDVSLLDPSGSADAQSSGGVAGVVDIDPSPPSEETSPALPELDPDEEYALHAVYESLKTAIIEPDRVVKCPQYLFRWLPYKIGAATLFVYIALLQELFLQRKRPMTELVSVAATAEDICRWSGVSRMTLHRLTQKGGLFEWLGKKETAHRYAPNDGSAKIKRLPSEYYLYYLPITPGDAQDIREFLFSHNAARDPVGALQAALACQPNEILRYPVRLAGDFNLKKLSPSRTSIRGILAEIAEKPISAEASQLCDKLYDRLILPDKFVLVSWYFLQNWLPLLGHEAAMAIILAKSMCYVNHEDGTFRDEIWFEQGYDGLAERLGLDSGRTVQNWFPSDPTIKRRNPAPAGESARIMEYHAQMQGLVTHFLQVVPSRSGHYQKGGVKIRVRRADPLIPPHQQLYESSLRIFEVLREDGRETDFLKLACKYFSVYDGTHKAQNLVYKDTNVDSKSVYVDTDGPENQFSLLQRDWNLVYADTNGQRVSVFIDTIKALDFVYTDPYIKILTFFQDTCFKPDTINQDTIQPDSETSFDAWIRDHRAAGVFTDRLWNREKLFSKINSELRREMVEKEVRVELFISWLIYGAATEDIKNPMSLALARLKQKPDVGAGGASERLANWDATKLAELIYDELYGGRYYFRADYSDWKQLFRGEHAKERIRLLADLLNLK